MKVKHVGIFWGAVLVVAGVWFLATGANSITIEDPYLGLALTAGLSALFFASYFISGAQHWGWLFPACIFAGVSLVIVFWLLPVEEGAWMAVPVLAGAAAPFLVAYFQNRRERRWALIPAYAMAALTLVVLVADWLPEELIGTLVMLAIALPFLGVYLLWPGRKWALIPFGVLAIISLIPLLAASVSEDLIGVAIMFLFAVPFLVVYTRGQRNWWALIPAGGFITIAMVVWLVMFLLEGRSSGDLLVEKVAGGVLFVGWGLTFLFLWLRRASAPTAWAVYPAVALGLLALVSFLTGETGLIYAWPLAIIAVGVLLLYSASRRKLLK